MGELLETTSTIMTNPWLRPPVILGAATLIALMVRLLFARVVLRLTRRTQTDIDDRLVHVLRGPVVLSVFLCGIAWILLESALDGFARFVLMGLIQTVAAVIWTVAAMRVVHIILEVLSRKADSLQWVQPRTLPLIEISMKILVFGGLLYFACIAWNIPLTSWLASAGIVGIAVGFAAKDTLANLFSGFFILADAPYKVGDFIILDEGIRGIVSDIGIRSTRLLTRDDIEVTVPNAVIGNAKIVNETGGPHDKMRVRVKVGVAYGSDVDQVQETLLSCIEGVEHLTDEPAPRVRFRELGESSLNFELLAWIDEPVFRGGVLHALNTRVYKALGDAGIEIPFPKRDVYIKEQPEPRT